MRRAKSSLFVAAIWAFLSHAPNAAGLELSVEVRSQADKTLQTAKVVSLRAGAAVSPCQLRSETTTYLCQASLTEGAVEELALEVEPTDASRFLQRRVPLDAVEWQARGRAALTVFIAGPVGSVSYSTIDTARRHIESPDPQPDRALALLEAINERLLVQPAAIATLNRGLFLFNYGRALQNLCLDRNRRYATCDSAVSALQSAVELQRQNPDTLSVEEAKYSAALVTRAISDIETDRMQRAEAKRTREYRDATVEFRRSSYCTAGEKFAALVESYEHAPDEARYLRNSGAFYFLLSYQLALSQLNCGLTKIRSNELAEGCGNLKIAGEGFADVIARAESESVPAGQEVLWRSHRARIAADLPAAIESARQARTRHCAGS